MTAPRPRSRSRRRPSPTTVVASVSVEDVKRRSHLLGPNWPSSVASDHRRVRRRRSEVAPQVPRHLPAGRPRRPPRAGLREAAARLLVHGPHRRPGRRAHRRAVAGPRPPRRPDRRHDAPHHPPGRAVPLRPQGLAAPLVNGINAAGLTTLAACGDVVRNIMACPWPDERQAVLARSSLRWSRRFRPQTTAYWELWVDGDKAVTAEPLRSRWWRRR